MTKNERRVERLIELRRVLRNHARAEARAEARGVSPQDAWGDPQVACTIGGKRVAWDMSTWVNDEFDDGVPRRFRCDTAACALGSAALDPWHNERGLRFPKGGVAPYYAGSGNGLDAGARFYGITGDEAAWLFIPDEYLEPSSNVRPTDVIARVNSLIKHYRDGRDDDLYRSFAAGLGMDDDDFAEAYAQA